MKAAPGPAGAKPANETLGLLLVRQNKITRAQLYEALREQRASGQRLGDILFEKGWIGEEELTMLVARQLDLEYIAPELLEKVPKGLIEKFPAKVAEEFRCVPVRFWKGKLTVAVDDQRTRTYVDEISFLTGSTCVAALAAPGVVREWVKRFYGIALEARTEPSTEKASRPAPSAAKASEREQPTGKLEALPRTGKDEQGRETVSARTASGDEVLYLLTEVAKPGGLVPVAETDEPEAIALTQPASAPAAPAGPAAPPARDDEPHDNFLAPDVVEDDRPMFKPKSVSAPAPAPSATAPEPAPAPEPALDPASDEPAFDIVQSAERLFECTDSRGIGEVVVSFARNLLDRAILFDVSGPRYTVLAGASSLPEDDRAAEFSAAREELVLLGIIAQTKQPSYGPTPTGDMYDRFFDRLGFLKPPFIMLYPLVVAGQTRAVLFGGLGALRPPEDFGDLQMLFKEAATALEILEG